MKRSALTPTCDAYNAQLRARGERPVPGPERADVTLRANVTVTVRADGRVWCWCSWCGLRVAMPVSAFVASHVCPG